MFKKLTKMYCLNLKILLKYFFLQNFYRMDARLPWSGSDGDDDDEELVILQENKNTKSKNPVSNGAPGSNDLEIIQVKSGPGPPRIGLNSGVNSSVFNCDICNLKFPGNVTRLSTIVEILKILIQNFH